MLRYGPDDFNCLHQDLYGDLVFPLQIVILLSDPGHDFTGGELLLVEQRPRAQSRAEIAVPASGFGRRGDLPGAASSGPRNRERSVSR